MKNKPKICFVALAAYHLLSGRNTGIIGGSELQEVTLAKELVKDGYDVSFVVADHGQKSSELIDGIKVFKAHQTNVSVGTPLKALSLWKAFNRANADIYFLRAGLAGIVSLYCLLKKKKFVYSVANPRNITGELIIDDFRHRYIFNRLNKFDLKCADAIIVQTEYQRELLRQNFDKNGVVVKNMCPWIGQKQPKKIGLPVVLWVSTLREIKQPELFLRLAKEIPDAKFQMIGGAAQENLKIYEEVKKSVSEIPNMEFLGFVPHQKMDQYYSRAGLFVNTSVSEGFPNTFLEAWARCTPTVTLAADPDEVICKNKLGFHSKTFQQMVKDVELLLKNGELRKELGKNSRKYVEREHDPQKIVEQYKMLFEGLSK